MEVENNLANQDGHSGQVALPFNESQFKDFIVSLLGKPQTITKRFRGSFEINKDSLIGLFELLNQRVYQQNESSLIQFRATVYYDDNSTVTLNGFDHLVNFNERMPLVSTAVHLTWQYLVKFRDKKTYEKQEISVSFVTSQGVAIASIDEDIYYHPNQSFVSVRIAHTARTWGADIEALLTRHIKTIVKKDHKFFQYFQYNYEKVEHLISALLIGITLAFSISKTLSLPDNNSVANLIKHYGNLLFLFFGVYFLLKVTLIFLEEFEVYGKPSAVLLTPESEKAKQKHLKRYRKEWVRYFLTMVISLLLGILSNYLYNHFWI